MLPNTCPSVVLATLNAKYIHASLGLRYLLANMERHGSRLLAANTVLREFTIQKPPQSVVDELVLLKPQIVGLGVYIWNVDATTELVRLMKAQHPHIKVVLGGPEVSYEHQEQAIVAMADHVITGWGDVSFPKLCLALLHGPKPLMKIIAGEQPPLTEIELPYAHFSPGDLAHRLLYVEASRGCPFKCEFCLSSLDQTAWAYDLDRILGELHQLYERGARHFKFVDRTFNLKTETSIQILQFFLDRLPQTAQEPALFVHFEVIPDHLPDALKAQIALFPPGVLQFEVGIQSFNPQVQQRISRKQNNAKTEANLQWLLEHSHVHIHADLIWGLPGETLESLAAGFDRLYALGPHEIQLGLLKRLRGTPIARHTAEWAMEYDPKPPYVVRQTRTLSAETIERLDRMARYWDRVANSGRFTRALPLLMQSPAPDGQISPFWAFMAFSDSVWARHQKTAFLTPENWVDEMFDHLVLRLGLDEELVRQTLLGDYLASGARAKPQCLSLVLSKPSVSRPTVHLTQRQAMHASAQE